MIQRIDKSGRIIGSPQTMEQLVEHVLGSRIDAISVEEQIWSASGALHFAGVWRETQTPVLIKVGINPNQLYWTQQMAVADPGVVPALYACGDHLGDVQVGWTVMQRIAFGPLGPDRNGDEFVMLLEAAVRFQHAARTIEPRYLTTFEPGLIHGWMERGSQTHVPGPVEEVRARIDHDWAWLTSVCQFEICHGDVHMCNVLTWTPPPLRGDALLIDCQPILQPWPFEAAYPQILNSTDQSRVGYSELVPKMARLRSARGMSSCEGDQLEQVARITLAWYAVRMWAMCPDRHAIADYREATERYIAESAAMSFART